MPTFDLQLVRHQLNIKENDMPVKQALRNFRPELELQTGC